jgi:hypothetical protein
MGYLYDNYCDFTIVFNLKSFRNFKFNTDNLIPQRHIQYLNNLKKQNLIVGISIPQNVMTEKHQQIKYIKDKLITFKKE